MTQVMAQAGDWCWNMALRAQGCRGRCNRRERQGLGRWGIFWGCSRFAVHHWDLEVTTVRL